MPTDSAGSFDSGLLSPVTAGADAMVSDAAFLDALVTAEVALARAELTVVPGSGDVDEAAPDMEWVGPGELVRDHGITVSAITAAAAGGGNPVIPLVAAMRERGDFHRGATSQDILDSALMLTAARARSVLLQTLDEVERTLGLFARAHRDRVAVARTLTQHAVPTTVGLRAANWLQGVQRSTQRLRELSLPVQLGGAAGTLSAFVDRLGEDAAADLPAAFAKQLGLDTPIAPWHTVRWPITELGDSLVQVIDALGVIATDVSTLGRTEVGELAEGTGGGSSTMPQKRNPVASVLIRSAAMRAPQLGATLHLASSLAVDERPDGAWHAEWPTLRELLRLALGASSHALSLVSGLVVDEVAIARNLTLTQGLIMAERVTGSAVAVPQEQAADLIRRAQAGEQLSDLLAAAGVDASVLDPASYTGLAGRLVDRIANGGES